MEAIEGGAAPYAQLWDELKSMEYALHHLTDPNWRLGDLDREQIAALADLLKSLSHRSQNRPIYLSTTATHGLNSMQRHSFPQTDLRKEIRVLRNSPTTGAVFKEIGDNLSRLAGELAKAASQAPTVHRRKNDTIPQSDLRLVKTCLDSLLTYVAANLTVPHAELTARPYTVPA